MRNKIFFKRKPLFALYKPQEQYGGQKWEFHLTDNDGNFPSVLHAHAVDQAWKLDGYDGGIYDIPSKKLIDKLSKKELAALHRNKKFCDFTRRRIEWYNQNHIGETELLPNWAKHGKTTFMQFYNKRQVDSFTFIRVTRMNKVIK